MKDRTTQRCFRILLTAYPADFRSRYGDEMEEAFAHILHLEREEHGRVRWTWVWMRAAWDACTQGSRQRWRGRVLTMGRGPDGDVPQREGRELMGSLISDIRYAVRTLGRRPVFTLTAIVTLALGIGANTSIFSVVNGLLIRDLPYENPEDLVVIWAQNPTRGWTRTDQTVADAWDYRNRTAVFEDVAVYDRQSVALTGTDRPERLAAHGVTLNMMSLLGAVPAQGRDFLESDGVEDAPPVVLLSDGFWKRRFGADPEMVGSTLSLDGNVTTVVGIMPDGFLFMEARPDIWLPFRFDPATAARGNHSNIAIGRLAHGVTIDRANTEVGQVAASLAEEFPETNEGWGAVVVDLQRDMVGPIGLQASIVLMGAVGFILLMATTNVANLMLARANGRRQEMAIRAAMGAGRMRVIRQLLTESVLLALVGGGVGVALAVWSTGFIVKGLPSNTPAVFQFGLDRTVLVFAFAVSVLSALLFGLAPALRASNTTSLELREGGRSGHGRKGRKIGGFLVVVQTALAVVLLVGGGIMTRSVIGMASKDLGYEPAGLLTFRITPPEAKYQDRDAVAALHDELLERVRGLAGVEGAGSVHVLPLGGSNTVGSFALEGDDPDSDDARHSARFDYVSTGYFAAMDIAVVRGRAIDKEDTVDGPRSVVVNETLARRFFPDEDPVGRRLLFSDQQWSIVGVVEDHFERSLAQPPRPSVYVPSTRFTIRSRSIVVRTAGAPTGLVAAVQRAVQAIDPDLPIYNVMPLADVVAARVGAFALIAQLMGAFAVISLILGAVGIYGVTVYGVGQRTNEIGIRIALGAQAGQVRSMVVRQGMFRSILGVVIGLGLAFGVTRAMTGLLVGVSATDPATFSSVTVLLLIVAFLGSYLPALRASAVNPVTALSQGP